MAQFLTDEEMANLEAEHATPAPSAAPGVLTDEQMAALEKEHAPEQKGLFSEAIDKALKGLGYTGGQSRNAIAQGLDKYLGTQVTRPEDWERTKSGEAPITAEYLERAGVPEGPKMSDLSPFIDPNGAMNVSTRGVAGFAGDVATDPLTYLSGGLSSAAKAGKGGKLVQVANRVVNPLESALEGGGRTLFKSGVKNIDSRLEAKGMEPIAQDLLNQGIWGKSKSLQEGMESRMSDLADKRKALYSEATDKGVTVDPRYASQDAQKLIAELRQNPYMAPKADKAQEFLDLAQKPMSMDEASKAKTSLYDALPDSAFDPNGNLNDTGKKLMRELSLGYKREIENAGNFARPGLGNEIAETNREWGGYLNAQKPTRSEIAKADRKDLVTQVKAALFKFDPLAALAMYGAQGLNSGAVRTGAGLALDRTAGPVGRALVDKAPGLTDPVARALLWQSVQDKKRGSK